MLTRPKAKRLTEESDLRMVIPGIGFTHFTTLLFFEILTDGGNMPLVEALRRYRLMQAALEKLQSKKALDLLTEDEIEMIRAALEGREIDAK